MAKDFFILVCNGKLNVIAETSQQKDFNGLGTTSAAKDVLEILIKYAEDRTQCLFTRFEVVKRPAVNVHIGA